MYWESVTGSSLVSNIILGGDLTLPKEEIRASISVAASYVEQYILWLRPHHLSSTTRKNMAAIVPGSDDDRILSKELYEELGAAIKGGVYPRNDSKCDISERKPSVY